MYTDFLQTTLKHASEIANKNFGDLSSVSTKKDDNNQVLTTTDLEIGTFIVQKIQDTYPDHNVIDEEAGVIDKKSEFTWVVDPIDGTSNFANGLRTYGIMIGLLDRSRPIAGGVILPAFQELYTAEKGSGAYCNEDIIHVTQENKLLSSLVAYGIDGHQEDPERTKKEMQILTNIVLQIRNLRTTNSAYDMVQVASGKYGAFLNQTTKIWDNVAIQPIIEEAGGIVTDFWGNPIDYTDPISKADQNFTICAASPELHKQLQEIIKES